MPPGSGAGSRRIGWTTSWRSGAPHWPTCPRLCCPSRTAAAGAEPSQRGAEIRCDLPQPLVERLRALAQEQSATLYMVLLAAFSVLLSRYSDQQDIALGTPTANRQFVEVEPLIGSFINTLVMRVDLAGQPTFRTLLNRVRGTALTAYDHQDVPFERLVEALRPARRLHQNPLINVMFQVHDLTPPPVTLPGLTVMQLDAPDEHAKFDLDCSFVMRSGGLRGCWRYAVDIFDAATIERMTGHFQTLVAGIVANPDCPIDQLPLLTAAERRQMLVTWNQTAADFPAARCIHDLISAQAALTPHAIAVVCGAERLSYAELLDRADRLAASLQAMGIGADDLVALYLTRSATLIVALLAVLKAGAAYVPLDPDHPAQRTALILNDAAIRVLLTEGPLLATLPPTHATIVDLDDPAAFHASRTLDQRAGPENLAYLLYTSGSTGLPKGVAVEHRALVNVITAVGALLQSTADDRWLAISTLTFDIASLEILLPLATGACVIVARTDESKDPWRLQTLLTQSDATMLQATPSTWRMLIDAGWSGSPALRMISAGEALSMRLAQELLARGKQLWNLYGPTETTIYATFHAVQHDDGAPPIGRPVANTKLYVLERGGQPAPVGIPGELYIGGMGLARGYYGQPDLTAERFVGNPFVADAAARLYRTGDLVRWRADGLLEYLGRNDHQVKIRGHRIELEEVQAALSQHPAVQSCVVVAQPATADELQIVAYFVPRQGARPDTGGLRHFLRSTLPEAMIPAHYIELTAMPMTPSGKLDRAALPDPANYGAAHSESFVPPQSPLELVIARIWSTVLGRSEIGVHDNFFDLGGHSLMATRVVSRLRSHLQIDLPLAALFEAPTVAGLATAIAARSAALLPWLPAPTGDGTEPETEEFVL
jgi:amino acid adenylation domain-containing protein